ncbi:MAG TPA: glutamine synthetase family protein, partial [Thermoanaerobaculia bacterium]
ADLLEMADRHSIYKHAAKEIAWQNNCSVTFMAKWDERYAGSSCHIHASLWSPDGKPLFKGDESLGPIQCSNLFRWFLGGWMAHIRELFPFFAPYPSSYKRYVAGSFAPTGIAWSYDNRTAGFRIVGHGSSLRIECRTAGADANVYLAFAATLAAGLDGIANRIEPPAAFDGDIYGALELPQVPHTLPEAIAALEQSAFARETFGNDVIEHYLHFFRTEQRKFDAVVTDWERRRYFEQA